MIIFKLPNDGQWYTVKQVPTSDAVKFFSFDTTVRAEFFGTIEPIKISEATFPALSTFENEVSTTVSDDASSYQKKVSSITKLISSGAAEKVVLSRKTFRSGRPHLPTLLKNLSAAYPTAFTYLFDFQGDVWCGSFSEILGIYDQQNRILATMSLAGTVAVDEAWTHKEYAEQQAVTDYIQKILLQYTGELQISGPADHISGNIKHLRTDIQCTLEQKDLESVIARLHPTPAVCGVPKEAALDIIEEYENHAREFYSGYSQVIFQDKIYYFVTLRCGKLYENGALLYVGGGLNKDSDPLKEWQETERKANALGQFI